MYLPLLLLLPLVQVYEMPDSLSSCCQALLRRLLHPDPLQRIKMEGVLRDPWFLTGTSVSKLKVALGNLAGLGFYVRHQMLIGPLPHQDGRRAAGPMVPHMYVVLVECLGVEGLWFSVCIILANLVAFQMFRCITQMTLGGCMCRSLAWFIFSEGRQGGGACMQYTIHMLAMPANAAVDVAPFAAIGAGLPPGALDMVDKFLSRPSSCTQSEADIEQIVAAAAAGDVMQEV